MVNQGKNRTLPRAPGPGCVIDLPLIEGSGTTLHDVSGNENDASVTLNGLSESDFWVQGKFGHAIDFAATAHAVVSHDSTLNLNSEATFEFLIWVRNFNGGSMFDKRNGTIPYSFSTASTPRLNMRTENGGSASGVRFDNVSDKRLYHVIVTVDPDANQLELVVNGMMIDRSSISGTFDSNTADLYLGKYNGSPTVVDSILHSFRIYDRAMSRGEMLQHYTNLARLGLVQGSTRWFDSSWNEQMHMDPANNEVLMSSGGAKLYVNGSGEIVVEDEGGNTTTIS